MICNHAHECGSRECEHRNPHPANEFCRDGQCRWAGDTNCVPESKREMVEILLKGDEFIDLSEDEFVDRIMVIFEGEKEAPDHERDTCKDPCAA